eukprot:TRINITY_DN859_c0_g1_i1.p1 TRINITY_DN859_c0_g1~~TRINITY_DN859_c0_g1_i1.p1  ORF type:complete len:111 (-),score=24.61 TRINITY_DN859_c0_g1_i1:94-426(-)
MNNSNSASPLRNSGRSLMFKLRECEECGCRMFYKRFCSTICQQSMEQKVINNVAAGRVVALRRSDGATTANQPREPNLSEQIDLFVSVFSLTMALDAQQEEAMKKKKKSC